MRFATAAAFVVLYCLMAFLGASAFTLIFVSPTLAQQGDPNANY